MSNQFPSPNPNNNYYGATASFSNPPPPPPPLPPSSTFPTLSTESLDFLQELLFHLKEDIRIITSTASIQESLTTLTQYTNPNNHAHISYRTILDHIISIFFLEAPQSTTVATSFILELSTLPSTRIDIVCHSGGAVLSRLLETLTNRHFGIPSAARKNAALTFCQLAQEPKNKIPLGSTDGLILGLANFWMDESIGVSGQQCAGTAISQLLTSCVENVQKLLDVKGAVERIVGLAIKHKEGERWLWLRKTAFMVMEAIGRTKRGSYKLVVTRGMDTMVRLLTEGGVEISRWCLKVTWGLFEGELKQWEFKRFAERAGLEVQLSKGKKEWGSVERRMVAAMLGVIRRRTKRRLEMLDDDKEKGEGSKMGAHGGREGGRVLDGVIDYEC